jgi:hypothetical protein
MDRPPSSNPGTGGCGSDSENSDSSGAETIIFVPDQPEKGKEEQQPSPAKTAVTAPAPESANQSDYADHLQDEAAAYPLTTPAETFEELVGQMKKELDAAFAEMDSKQTEQHDSKPDSTDDNYNNIRIRCPNSYCRCSAFPGQTRVPLHKFVEHQVMEHGVPIYGGPSNKIPIWQERLKHREKLLRVINADGVSSLKYEWVPAMIRFDQQHFYLRVYEDEEGITMWVQQLLEPPSKGDNKEKEKCQRQDKDASKSEQASDTAPVKRRKVYWSNILIRNPNKPFYYRSWNGRCAPPGLPSATTLKEHENFYLHRGSLESNYVKLEPGSDTHTWEIQVDLEIEEEPVNDNGNNSGKGDGK